MKKIIVSAVVAFTVLTTSDVFAQQGFGTNTPDRSAAVDIVSNKRGLLIPRIAIPNLDQAAPVANPANALMVYNTGTADAAAGFYYWDATYNNNAGRWVRFVSSNSGSAVTVSAGTNVTVKPTPDGHDMDYNVSVKGGDVAGQVLVTEIVNINGETVQTTKWVNPQDFINGSVVGENGITTDIKTVDGKEVVTVGLGGDLNTATTIKTTVGADGKPGNTLAITGLEKLDGSTGKEFDAANQNIVIMGADGILKVVTPKALLEEVITEGVNGKALTSSSISVDTNGATALLKDVNIEITAGDTDGLVMVTKVDAAGNKTTEWRSPAALSNTLEAGQGISIDGDNKINLGGNPITTPTELNIEDANASLAIKGLTDVTETNPASNNVVVADPTTGVLKQTSTKELVEDVIGGTGTNELKAKALKGDGITVTTTGSTTLTEEVANSLLKDVTLGIADGAVTTAKIADGAVKNGKIADGAVSQEKLYAGTIAADGTKAPAEEGSIPVAGPDGIVVYEKLNTAIGSASLKTDGKIVIGDNQASTILSENTVLVETLLSIKQGSIGTTELTNKGVTAEKLNAGETTVDTPRIGVADQEGNVTYEELSGANLNGKALTSGSISVFGGEKALLDATRIDITGGTTKGDVLITSDEPMKDAAGNVVTDAAGNTVYVTKWVTPTALDNTVTASNGLTVEEDTTNVILGGTIDRGTTLIIAAGTEENGTVTGAGSLAIKGLNTADSKQGNKTVVVQADGQLATIDKGVGDVVINGGDTVNNVTIGGDVVTNYHPSMSEIVIEVNLGGADTNLTLPAINGTEGQTISVKIANTNENHNGYLNIKAGNDVLAYGAMPYQGWIIKSNGAKWIVVGRN
ncbi:hypothetical protein [Myroides sp. DW712]|uniref:hypothetical protein n=1 Tax=Myroides sp. DW712 TaxID=3389800 RepID=UPI00397D3608